MNHGFIVIRTKDGDTEYARPKVGFGGGFAWEYDIEWMDRPSWDCLTSEYDAKIGLREMTDIRYQYEILEYPGNPDGFAAWAIYNTQSKEYAQYINNGFRGYVKLDTLSFESFWETEEAAWEHIRGIDRYSGNNWVPVPFYFTERRWS